MGIYLDYAASTPLDAAVEAEMLPYLRAIGNPSSIHKAGRWLRTAIEEARQTIADLIGAEPGEIIFTSGATESDNHALRGAVETFGIRHVLYNPTEHHAVTHTIEALAEAGRIEAHPIRIDAKGRVDLNHLEELLRRYPRSLVAVMYINNEIGTRQPVQAIAQITHTYGGYYLCDAVQGVGLGEINVKELDIDFLAASAHKFYGPKGIGFLYRKYPIRSLITGGAQEREQRAGTENVAAIVGMAKALSLAYMRSSSYKQHLARLKVFLIERLQHTFPAVHFHGDISLEGSHPGILNFRLPPPYGHDLMLIHLDLHEIYASGTSACASGSGHPSHVLQALGLPPEEARKALRFSWGKETTQEDLEKAVEVLYSATLQRT